MSPRRLRAAIVLLAAALLLPAALLVDRALHGAEAEQAARHRIVAERLFDEMERTLSELVVREEARAVEAWSDASSARIAALPSESYVLGYFQIEPDGRVTTPLPPRDPEALRAVRDWLATREREVPAEKLRSFEQKPGTTVSLDERDHEQQPLADARKEGLAPRAATAPEPKGAYEALQSLNRGAEERADRVRKLVTVSPELAPPEVAPAEPQQERAKSPIGRAAQGAPQAIAARRDVADSATATNQLTRVAVDPLIGRRVDARHLLLYRSVFAGSAALRQGLVLDVEALGSALRTGADRVRGAVLTLSTGAGSTPEGVVGGGAFGYRHRFAEPFDAITASLVLAPLEGTSGAGSIYALAGLLVLTGGVGLFAIHRMVTVAMAFAERRSNFVAAVTHELKTPLTAIRMYGEMLRDDLVLDDAKRREYYRTITAESERLSRLIDNVLEFSRLEKGTREMRLEVGPLGPVVEEVAELLRPHAEREGFALQVTVAPDLPPVRFERDALSQVLLNLVDNALKYARRAEPRAIAIECRRHGDGVVLAVRDRGPGVAGRQLARIFEPFHRGEDELVRTTQGTGLGLALVKGLVERMGGSVGGSNAPGGGFEVGVALPAASPRATPTL